MSYQNSLPSTRIGRLNPQNKHNLIIIKPGFLHLCSKIIKIFADNGWSVAKIKTKQLTLSEAKELYAMHKSEPFYRELCKYMSSGPSMAIIITKEKKMSDVVFKSVGRLKNIIRDRWGLNEMRNAIHSSDSVENMNIESKIYFNEQLL